MANNIPQVEIGFALCQLPDGKLTRGALGVGSAIGVQFSSRCPPPSKLVATTHSHPRSGGGHILPSAQDMREAVRLKMPALCIINEERSACYKVRGVNPA